MPSNGASWCNIGFTLWTDPASEVSTPWERWGDNPYLFNISTLDRVINKDTDTWRNRPNPVDWVATIAVENSGKVTTTGGDIRCQKGQAVSFLLHPFNLAGDGGLKWFELDIPLHGITHGITYDMYV